MGEDAPEGLPPIGTTTPEGTIGGAVPLTKEDLVTNYVRNGMLPSIEQADDLVRQESFLVTVCKMMRGDDVFKLWDGKTGKGYIALSKPKAVIETCK